MPKQYKFLNLNFVDGEQLISKSELTKIAKKETKKHKSLLIRFEDDRTRLLLHSRVLDTPMIKLPFPLSVIQRNAFIIRVIEMVNDKITRLKEYPFPKFEQAVDEFLKGVTDEVVVLNSTAQ